MRHSRTPRLAKVCFWLAISYALLPFDFIPDFVPVVGHLDDLLVVPGLLWLAVRLTPPEVMFECRRAIQSSRLSP